MKKFITELIEPLLEKSTIKSESSKLKKLLSKLRIPKSYINNQQKLIIYLQNNPAILTQFLKLVGESKVVNEATEIKQVVGIYGGRFQPFGPHHKKTFEWLEKQVDDAYITTSDIKRPPKWPFNYKEKVRHMTKMGIPSNKIIKEKTPYVASNTLKKFDKESTAVIYIWSKRCWKIDKW